MLNDMKIIPAREQGRQGRNHPGVLVDYTESLLFDAATIYV